MAVPFASVSEVRCSRARGGGAAARTHRLLLPWYLISLSPQRWEHGACRSPPLRLPTRDSPRRGRRWRRRSRGLARTRDRVALRADARRGQVPRGAAARRGCARVPRAAAAARVRLGDRHGGRAAAACVRRPAALRRAARAGGLALPRGARRGADNSAEAVVERSCQGGAEVQREGGGAAAVSRWCRGAEVMQGRGGAEARSRRAPARAPAVSLVSRAPCSALSSLAMLARGSISCLLRDERRGSLLRSRLSLVSHSRISRQGVSQQTTRTITFRSWNHRGNPFERVMVAASTGRHALVRMRHKEEEDRSVASPPVRD